MGILDDIGADQFMPSFSMGGDSLILLLWFVVLALMLGIIGILWWRWMQYKYRVILDEPRGNSLLRGVTEARKIKEKNGAIRWYVKSLKKKVNIPNLELISPSMEKRLRFGVIELLKVDEETYLAQDVSLNLNKTVEEQKIRFIPLANSLNNIRQITQDLKRDYNAVSWLKENAAILVQLAGLGMIIGCMIVLAIIMQDTVSGVGGVSSKLGDAIDKLATLIEAMNECRVEGVS